MAPETTHCRHSAKLPVSGISRSQSQLVPKDGIKVAKEQFRQQLRERGYGKARIREFEPNLDKEIHTHDQSAMALVMRGEFTLVRERDATTYRPG
jgi:quercetin dioxygenase-like cupin family protein